MTLSHDGFSFGNHRHTPVVASAPPEPQIEINRVWGLKGEGHVLAEKWGAEVTCRLTMSGYSTRMLLQAALDEVNERIGRLTGDLIENTPSGSVRFSDCTFIGAMPMGPPFLDGSGRHGWVQFVNLIWRSRKPVD